LDFGKRSTHYKNDYHLNVPKVQDNEHAKVMRIPLLISARQYAERAICYRPSVCLSHE